MDEPQQKFSRSRRFLDKIRRRPTTAPISIRAATNDSPQMRTATVANERELSEIDVSSLPPETNAQKSVRADKIKNEGNMAFEAENFDDAIELYTQAFGRRHPPEISQHCHRLALQKYGQIQFISLIAQNPTWP